MYVLNTLNTASNVADDGEEDDSDDGEWQEQVAADTQDTDCNEMEDSQSSASSNRVTTPSPLTPCGRPTAGKRMLYGTKRDSIKEKLIQIIKKPEKEPGEDEMFCLSLAATLRKIHDPQKKEYTGGSCLSHTAVKPDSCLAQIFSAKFLCIIKLIIIIG